MTRRKEGKDMGSEGSKGSAKRSVESSSAGTSSLNDRGPLDAMLVDSEQAVEVGLVLTSGQWLETF